MKSPDFKECSRKSGDYFYPVVLSCKNTEELFLKKIRFPAYLLYNSFHFLHLSLRTTY